MARGNIVGQVTVGVRGDLTPISRDLRDFEKRQALRINTILNNAPNASLGRITSDLSQFNKSLEASNARVIAFGASVGVIAGITQSFRGLVSATIDVNKALVDINSVLNLNTDGLAKFSRELFQVQRNTASAFQTTVEAAVEFSRQGLSATETLTRVNDALTLTRLSGLQATKAVESLTAAVNGFQRSAITTNEVLNKFATTDAAFAVSSRDLAEALARVGASAQDANVSLDELIALVTATQQITARGGSVIGNSFKTIFTRLQRPRTLNILESLGIEVKEATGAVRPAVAILTDLANTYDRLSQSQQSQIAETVGGVFQINILKSVLGDLNKEYSIYNRALQISSSATDEATKRNLELNKSLNAQLVSIGSRFKEIGALVGEKTFGDSFRSLLGGLDSVLAKIGSSLGGGTGEEIGSKIADGVLKAIGNVLSGPGLVLAGKILTSIVRNTFSDLKMAGTALMSNSKSIERQAQLQSAVNTLIGQGNSQYATRIMQATSLAEKEKIIVELLRQQVALSQTRASIIPKEVFAGKGLQGFAIQGGQVVERRGLFSRGASGILPYVAQESKDIKRGVGGAKQGDKPVIIPNFSFGGGKKGTVVAHTGEYIVPNYMGGDGSAIYNRKMVKEMGLPKGARKITAAGGLVPSWEEVDPRTISRRLEKTFMRGQSSAGFYDEIDNSVTQNPEAAKKLIKLYASQSYRNKDDIIFKKSLDIIRNLNKGNTEIIPNILNSLGLGQSRNALFNKFLNTGDALKDRPDWEKRKQYQMALLGDPSGLAIDSHFLGAAFGPAFGDGGVSENSFRKLKPIALKLAKKMGITPRMLQAGVFAGDSGRPIDIDLFKRGFDMLNTSKGFIPNYSQNLMMAKMAMMAASSPNELGNFLRKRLGIQGAAKGSTRAFFPLDEKYGIKIPINEEGLLQSQVEMDILNDSVYKSAYNGLIANVESYNPKIGAGIFERLQTSSSMDSREFAKAFTKSMGVSPRSWAKFARGDKTGFKSISERGYQIESLAADYDLQLGDLLGGNLGIASDGSVKILDAGYSNALHRIRIDKRRAQALHNFAGGYSPQSNAMKVLRKIRMLQNAAQNSPVFVSQNKMDKQGTAGLYFQSNRGIAISKGTFRDDAERQRVLVHENIHRAQDAFGMFDPLQGSYPKFNKSLTLRSSPITNKLRENNYNKVNFPEEMMANWQYLNTAEKEMLLKTAFGGKLKLGLAEKVYSRLVSSVKNKSLDSSQFIPTASSGLIPSSSMVGDRNRIQLKWFEKELQSNPLTSGMSMQDLVMSNPDMFKNLAKKFAELYSKGKIPNFAVRSRKNMGDGVRTLFTPEGSELSYYYDQENQTINLGYMQSQKRGQGREMFEALRKRAVKMGAPIYSQEIVPQQMAGLAMKGKYSQEEVFKMFPQLKWRQKDKVYGQINLPNIEEPYSFSSVEEAAKLLSKGKITNILRKRFGNISDITTIPSKFAGGYVPNFATVPLFHGTSAYNRRIQHQNSIFKFVNSIKNIEKGADAAWSTSPIGRRGIISLVEATEAYPHDVYSEIEENGNRWTSYRGKYEDFGELIWSEDFKDHWRRPGFTLKQYELDLRKKDFIDPSEINEWAADRNLFTGRTGSNYTEIFGRSQKILGTFSKMDDPFEKYVKKYAEIKKIPHFNIPSKDRYIPLEDEEDTRMMAGILNEALTYSYKNKKLVNNPFFSIPNFASPIKAAISREISAGVNPKDIYVDQDPRIKGPLNPAGLLVANKRDEPLGGFQGVNRALREKANPKTYGMIPNFAKDPKQPIDLASLLAGKTDQLIDETGLMDEISDYIIKVTKGTFEATAKQMEQINQKIAQKIQAAPKFEVIRPTEDILKQANLVSETIQSTPQAAPSSKRSFKLSDVPDMSSLSKQQKIAIAKSLGVDFRTSIGTRDTTIERNILSSLNLADETKQKQLQSELESAIQKVKAGEKLGPSSLIPEKFSFKKSGLPESEQLRIAKKLFAADGREYKTAQEYYNKFEQRFVSGEEDLPSGKSFASRAAMNRAVQNEIRLAEFSKRKREERKRKLAIERYTPPTEIFSPNSDIARKIANRKKAQNESFRSDDVIDISSGEWGLVKSQASSQPFSEAFPNSMRPRLPDGKSKVPFVLPPWAVRGSPSQPKAPEEKVFISNRLNEVLGISSREQRNPVIKRMRAMQQNMLNEDFSPNAANIKSMAQIYGPANKLEKFDQIIQEQLNAGEDLTKAIITATEAVSQSFDKTEQKKLNKLILQKTQEYARALDKSIPKLSDRLNVSLGINTDDRNLRPDPIRQLGLAEQNILGKDFSIDSSNIQRVIKAYSDPSKYEQFDQIVNTQIQSGKSLEEAMRFATNQVQQSFDLTEVKDLNNYIKNRTKEIARQLDIAAKNRAPTTTIGIFRKTGVDIRRQELLQSALGNVESGASFNQLDFRERAALKRSIQQEVLAQRFGGKTLREVRETGGGRSLEAETQRRLLTLAPDQVPAPMIQEAGIRDIFFAGTYRKNLEQINRDRSLTPEQRARKAQGFAQSREARVARLSQGAFVGSFAASTLAGFAPDNAAGRTFGSAAQLAGTGAMLGSGFGPLGIAIGAATGGLVGLAKGLNNLGKSVQEVTKTLSDLNAKNIQTGNAVTEVLQIEANLRDAIASGVSDERIVSQKDRQRQILLGIEDSDVRTRVASALGDTNQIEKILEEISVRTANQVRQNEALIKAVEALRERGSLTRTFFGESEKSLTAFAEAGASTARNFNIESPRDLPEILRGALNISVKDFVEVFGNELSLTNDQKEQFKLLEKAGSDGIRAFINGLERELVSQESIISYSKTSTALKSIREEFAEITKEASRQIGLLQKLSDISFEGSLRRLEDAQNFIIETSGAIGSLSGSLGQISDIFAAQRERVSFATRQETGRNQVEAVQRLLGLTDSTEKEARLAESLGEENFARLISSLNRLEIEPVRRIAEANSNLKEIRDVLNSLDEAQAISLQNEREQLKSLRQQETIQKARSIIENRNSRLSGFSGDIDLASIISPQESSVAKNRLSFLNSLESLGVGASQEELNFLRRQVAQENLGGIARRLSGTTPANTDQAFDILKRQAEALRASGNESGASNLERLSEEFARTFNIDNKAPDLFDAIDGLRQSITADLSPSISNIGQSINNGISPFVNEIARTNVSLATIANNLSFENIIAGLEKREAISTLLRDASNIVSINENAKTNREKEIANIIESLPNENRLPAISRRNAEIVNEMNMSGVGLALSSNRPLNLFDERVFAMGLKDALKFALSTEGKNLASASGISADEDLARRVLIQRRDDPSVDLQTQSSAIRLRRLMSTSIREQDLNRIGEIVERARTSENLTQEIVDRYNEIIANVNRLAGREALVPLTFEQQSSAQLPANVGAGNSIEIPKRQAVKNQKEAVEKAALESAESIFGDILSNSRPQSARISQGFTSSDILNQARTNRLFRTGADGTSYVNRISNIGRDLESDLAITSDQGERSRIEREIAQAQNDQIAALGLIIEKEKVRSRLYKDYDSIINSLSEQGRILEEQGNQLGALAKGFEAGIASIQKNILSLADIGQRAAEQFASGMGDAFGDFVTGAASAREAFSNFARSFLNDMARMFAQRSMSLLVGGVMDSFGFGGGMNFGGIKKASGGRVPALLTGGEYVIPKKAATNLGGSMLNKLNAGGRIGVQNFADGGMVMGGSGLIDDVPAMLNPGDFVIKKSSVNKYGADFLDSISSQPVQKRFLGGVILGGLLGGIGGALSSKKNRGRNALIGALGGAVIGGFASSVFGGASSANTAAAPNNSLQFNTVGGAQAGALSSAQNFGAQSGVSGATAATTGSTSRFSPMLLGLGASALLGGASMLFAPKEERLPNETLAQVEAKTNRAIADQNAQIAEARKRGEIPYFDEKTGNYGFTRIPATRRFAGGGRMPAQSVSSGEYIVPRQNASKIGYKNLQQINSQRFAAGGMVSGATTSANIQSGGKDASQPSINITINIEGSSETTSSANSGKTNENMNKLSQMIATQVKEIIRQEKRQGGTLSNLSK